MASSSSALRRYRRELKWASPFAQDGGQSLVEIALVLPLVVGVLLGGADLARVFATNIAVQSAARVGAQQAAMDRPPSRDATERVARDELQGPGLDARAAIISLTVHDGSGSDGSCVDPPTLARPCFATVHVQYTFRTFVQWPGVPAVIQLDRQQTIRRE
jgi:Flp pilus assembly protein TadG